jgi:uncharacterized protein YPO0396
MSLESEMSPFVPKDQFRMTRLQVYNWGTFSDLHDVPISEQGFLFVGRSGAGKSTLLDAFSALLVPPRFIDFNAAAREADRSGRDRSLVTYIRGAWAEQKDGESGEVTTRFLRSGTTWSALALTYQNACGKAVTLVQVFWLRGQTNSSSDVRRHYFIFQRPFELRELADFGTSNYSIQKLKHNFPDATARDEFRSYCELFCRLLGIESEMGLRLLHKTQSAKNLGNLNMFLRDFMLERPKTFEVADRLVSEFGELNAAYQAVVTARKQLEILVPARSSYHKRKEFINYRDRLDELKSGVDAYRESRRMELLKANAVTLHVKAVGFEGEISRCESMLKNHTAGLMDLEALHRKEGGSQIEHWEREVSQLSPTVGISRK